MTAAQSAAEERYPMPPGRPSLTTQELVEERRAAFVSGATWKAEQTAEAEARAPLSERQPIADRLRSLAAEHQQRAAYMLSYDADFLVEVAERIAPAVTS